MLKGKKHKMDDQGEVKNSAGGIVPDDIDVERNVSDFAGILERGYAGKIDKIISKIERKTSVEIAVVTIDSLKGESIDETALKLFNKFGVGKKEENNGVLFLISGSDNQYRIELGLGLEDIMDDDLQRRLFNNLISPNFKKRRFGKPILKFVRVIYDRIKGGKASRLSLITWLAGLLSLISVATGIFLSSFIALNNYIDIYSTYEVAILLAKTASPAVALAFAAIILGTVDIIRARLQPASKNMTIRSVWGIIFGVITVVLTAAVFLFFSHFILFLAGIFSLATGIY
ncbi:MAG: TPM domain-containing protein [Actinobacteria bacterium]|nr:TPM domain-containing protein [Actinomycetota bacterium]